MPFSHVKMADFVHKHFSRCLFRYFNTTACMIPMSNHQSNMCTLINTPNLLNTNHNSKHLNIIVLLGNNITILQQFTCFSFHLIFIFWIGLLHFWAHLHF